MAVDAQRTDNDESTPKPGVDVEQTHGAVEDTLPPLKESAGFSPTSHLEDDPTKRLFGRPYS